MRQVAHMSFQVTIQTVNSYRIFSSDDDNTVVLHIEKDDSPTDNYINASFVTVG